MLSSLHQLRINALLRVELDRIGTSLPAGGLEAIGIASVIVFIRTGFIRLVSLNLCSGPNKHHASPVTWGASSETPTVPNSTTNGDSYRSAVSSQQSKCNRGASGCAEILLGITQSLIHAAKSLQQLAEANYRLLRIIRYPSQQLCCIGESMSTCEHSIGPSFAFDGRGGLFSSRQEAMQVRGMGNGSIQGRHIVLQKIPNHLMNLSNPTVYTGRYGK